VICAEKENLIIVTKTLSAEQLKKLKISYVRFALKSFSRQITEKMKLFISSALMAKTYLRFVLIYLLTSNSPRAEREDKMTTIGSILTNDDVISKTRTPDNLRLYAYDVNGSQSFVEAAKELQAGQLVKYAVCSRDPEGSGNPPKIVDIITLQKANGFRCVRYCGEGDRPTGGGSSTFWGTIDDYGVIKDEDLIYLASHLALVIGQRGAWIFKMKVNKEA
jgi:hypothetical protein